MTIIIPYTGKKHGLSQLLVSLQPQLHPDDDIYIIDMTPDRSGLEIATLYGSSRCFIFVEPAKVDMDTAIKYGIENMKQNKQEGAIILTERCVISNTFVSNMKKAAKTCNHCTLFPLHLDMVHGSMDTNFGWYGVTQTQIDDSVNPKEVTDQCRYIRNDSDGHIVHSAGLVRNETIAVLPA